MNDPQDRNQNGSGLSRRDFIKGSGASAAAGALGTIALPGVADAGEAQPAGPPQFGPNAVRITLTVNGQRMQSNVEPRVTLLDALRNYLDVTGCKRVCDRGACGACTVMLDGKTVYACSMLAVEAQGKQIRTAESLVQPGGQVDRVPAAFAQHDAQQCGFCTPGFVVSMRAVFDEHQRPTPAQVEEGLAGNICRCGTYEQMRDAIYALCNQRRER